MPLNKEQRARVVAEAETWIGTPYVGWSKLKGPKGGVDCGQLLAGVYQNAGFLPLELTLPRNYSLQVSQHREDTEYINKVAQYMRVIEESEVQPGDVVVYKMGFAFAHAAIVIRWPEYVVHSIGRYGVCGGHGTAEPRFRKCQKMFFTLKDEWCDEHN